MDAEPSPAGKAAAAADKAKPAQPEFDIVRKKRTKLVGVPFQATAAGGIAPQTLQVPSCCLQTCDAQVQTPAMPCIRCGSVIVERRRQARLGTGSCMST